MADQLGSASGNATSADLLTGFTASVASGAISGSMPNNGSPTWIPGTVNQILTSGYYSSGTVNGDANLLASNILSGASIFGVSGSVTPKKYASGSGTSDSSGALTVSGLPFQPSTIVINDSVSGFGAPDANGGVVYSVHFSTNSEIYWGGTVAGVVSFGSTYNVNSSGFKLGVKTASAAYYWEAWE